MYRAGLEFNHPLVVRKAARHAGILPARWGLLEISAPNVVLTALKPGRNGSTILRVYEAAGTATAGVTLKLRADVTAAHDANLLEEPSRAHETTQDAVTFDLGPFEIKTLQVYLKSAAAR